MRVAIITSGFLPVVDGVTIAVWHRLQYLSQQGHQVLLLCPSYQPIAAVYPDWLTYVGEILPGITVFPLNSTPFMGLEFERNVSQKADRQLFEQLQKFQPDVIHVDEPERLQLGLVKIPGAGYAKRFKIPCVSFFHTNFIDYIEDYIPLPKLLHTVGKAVSQKIISRIYNTYDLTLAAGSTAYTRLAKMGVGNAVQGDFLGVAIDQYSPQLKSPHFFAEKYDRPDVDSKIKLTFLGRLTPDKGWNFTIAAFEQFAQQFDLNSVAVVIAGDGSMRDQIYESLNRIVPCIAWLGRIDPNEVPALLINSDIHITASEKETRGLTILEAFAAGVPVIAPRAGGVVDSIQDGHNGFLFEPQNQRDFLEKLIQLITSSELRKRMGTAGQKDVEHKTWESANCEIVSVWQQQIDRKSR